MALTVADTDVLIDFLHGKDPGASHVERHLKSGSLVTTVVTVFELLAGVRNQGEKDAVERLLRPLSPLPVTAQIAGAAASLFRDLKKRRQTIPMADCLIAALCIDGDASLLTRNLKHFNRIEGLRLAPLA